MTAQTTLSRARQYLNPAHPPIGRQTDHTRDALISELLSLCESQQRELAQARAFHERLEVYRQPEWPAGWAFAVTGVAGRYEHATAAYEAYKAMIDAAQKERQ
jgi:hypothetical protein